MSQRTAKGTLDWYIGHNTTSSIGFDPDGQCLKVCRTARNIPAKYPSALSAQVATPQAKRVGLTGVKPGMVAFYDDPKDDNPFGHVVTIKTTEPVVRSLEDFTVWTNSVKANTLVVVRGDYFGKHWGDKFQFAATWLNGVDLLMPVVPTGGATHHGLPRLHTIVRELDEMIAAHKKAGNTRIVTALQRDRAELVQTINQFK